MNDGLYDPDQVQRLKLLMNLTGQGTTWKLGSVKYTDNFSYTFTARTSYTYVLKIK